MTASRHLLSCALLVLGLAAPAAARADVNLAQPGRGGHAFASSEMWWAPAAHVLDDTPGRSWQTYFESYPAYVGVRWDRPQAVRRIAVRLVPGLVSYDLRVQWRDPGSGALVDVAEPIAGWTPTPENAERTFTLPAEVTTDEVRVTFTSGTAVNAQLDDLQAFGTPGDVNVADPRYGTEAIASSFRPDFNGEYPRTWSPWRVIDGAVQTRADVNNQFGFWRDSGPADETDWVGVQWPVPVSVHEVVMRMPIVNASPGYWRLWDRTIPHLHVEAWSVAAQRWVTVGEERDWVIPGEQVPADEPAGEQERRLSFDAIETDRLRVVFDAPTAFGSSFLEELRVFGAKPLANLALGGNGGVASASSTRTFAPSFDHREVYTLNDGVRQSPDEPFWGDATLGDYPDWAQVAWPAAQSIKTIVLRLPTRTIDPFGNRPTDEDEIGHAVVSVRDADGAWHDVGEVVDWVRPLTADGTERRVFTLPEEIRADVVRVTFLEGTPRGYSLLEEISAYPAPPRTDLPPANTALPSVTGAARLGATVTCDPGTWSGDPAFTYAWLRDGVAAGEGAEHVLSADDAGAAIACEVTATNPSGEGVATSDASVLLRRPGAVSGVRVEADHGDVDADGRLALAWDALAGSEDYEVQRAPAGDDAGWVPMGDAVAATQLDPGVQPEGRWRYRVRARALGLDGPWSDATAPVVVDTTPPRLALTCPAGPVLVGTEQAVAVTAADDGAGLAAPAPESLTLDTDAAGLGVASLTVLDRAGHATPASCATKVVWPRPLAPHQTAGANPGRDGRVSVAWSAAPGAPDPARYVLEASDARGPFATVAGGTTRTWSAPAAAPLGEGTWRLRVRADDPDFEPDPSDESEPIVVDRTAPRAPRLRPQGDGAWTDASGAVWYRDALTVEAVADGDPQLADGSDGSGVDPDSVPAPQVIEGTAAHQVTATVADRAGNRSATATATFRVDADAPVVTITCPTVVVRGTAAEATWRATDAGSGVDGTTSGTVPLDTDAGGPHTATAPAVRDHVGHAATSAACAYTVLYRAPSAPRVTAGANPSRDGRVTLSWGPQPGDPLPAAWRLDGRAGTGAWAQLYTGATGMWTPSAALAEGTWHARAAAVDPAFDPTPSGDSEGIVVDRTPPRAPALQTDRPADVTGADGRPWWRDAVTVSTVPQGDPDLPDGTPGSGIDPASVPAAQRFAASAAHALSATVTDRAGNQSPAATTTVRVDADAPVATLSCPDTVVLGSSAQGTWSAADTGSGLATSATGKVTLDTAAAGPHTASAPVARDRAGHASAAATCDYQVVYAWSGFQDPVDELPILNDVKSGDRIAVRFSLGGNRGLAVLDGPPQRVTVECPKGVKKDKTSVKPPPANTGLTYDPATGNYQWVWETDRDWKHTCAELVVRLSDGTEHRAVFRFK